MTTAHRPQIDPARGRSEMAPTRITASRALPAHLKLKYRQASQGTENEIQKRDLRADLLEAEARHYAKIGKPNPNILKNKTLKAIEGVKDETISTTKLSKFAEILESTREIDADTDSSDSESENEIEAKSPSQKTQHVSDSSSSDDSEDDDDDDEDEEEQLLRELERIKEERRQEQARQEASAQEEQQKKREREMLMSNSLLSKPAGESFAVKRRWDEDVIFRNTHKGVDEKRPKEFVNDMLRSDFHKKFMARFVR
ncbi:complexed with Cdc5 protein Cwf15 [Schizosaccharomyces japonicus yFS275]|uniref:Complexed with Cdc5 protein Cwf15 n=1 Tax=Schizosaccharomyces japonicus (strain yFS275 / FY16936) TaxID=402676 RepID=B6JVN1_SCHJY|nr:complexed with Cdc5 protein Cwf15 [Schizosaccharomyces japonicus yFS275]EEB05432.1 complexed with Cdc5 protein Cwf15 [Schizosaccharomyces japonicus yFS275]